MRSATVLRTAGFAALSLLALHAFAQSTTVTVDGKANCVRLSNNGSAGLPVAFALKAGQYKVKIKSSTTTICGDPDRCPQHAVLLDLQGADYNSPYMQTPVLVQPDATRTLTLSDDVQGLAYITDSVCTDNTGKTIVKITEVVPD